MIYITAYRLCINIGGRPEKTGVSRLGAIGSCLFLPGISIAWWSKHWAASQPRLISIGVSRP